MREVSLRARARARAREREREREREKDGSDVTTVMVLKLARNSHFPKFTLFVLQL